jgi:D-lactate dehydrogenase
MKVAIFDTHRYDREVFTEANLRRDRHHVLTYLEPRLVAETAVLAAGAPAVCSFVNDRVDAAALGVLRDAGVGLLNFSLEGLVGFDMHGKTAGIIGTGRIGLVVAKILRGFGCRVLAFDAKPDPKIAEELSFSFVPLDVLLAESDIVSLHVPLNPSTHHLLDAAAFARMKRGAMLINTGRGALIDTGALIAALKTGQVGSAGLDVYEEEEGIFFQDLSEQVLEDDVLARLLTFPNVLITSHQGFLTREALRNIAETTLASIDAYERGQPLVHEIRADP